MFILTRIDSLTVLTTRFLIVILHFLSIFLLFCAFRFSTHLYNVPFLSIKMFRGLRCVFTRQSPAIGSFLSFSLIHLIVACWTLLSQILQKQKMEENPNLENFKSQVSHRTFCYSVRSQVSWTVVHRCRWDGLWHYVAHLNWATCEHVSVLPTKRFNRSASQLLQHCCKELPRKLLKLFITMHTQMAPLIRPNF